MPKSLQIRGADKIGIKDVEKPCPEGNQILVKVVASGQNPLDVAVVCITASVAEFVDYYNGNTIGCDFAGIVEAVGPQATRFQPGDRVGGFLPGNLQEQGAFVEESFSTRLPASMPFEYAATIGVAASTAAIALYSHLNLPRYGNGAKPFNQYLLVNGGSSATGTMIIQIAKLSGARVIALTSPRNFDLVKSYGADKAFDYQHPDVAAMIRDYTGDAVGLAVNCLPTRESCKLICDCISSTGGRCVNLVPVDTSDAEFRKDVDFSLFMAFQVFNKDFQLGSDMYAASQDLRELVKDFWKQIDEEFMPRNSLKIHPVKIIQNGLEGVPESHKQMLDGQVSGWKFVARIADTPGI
ncbi:unnamed protein product [Clonostachys rosea f. rosea IK726]|uniref:Uncharacterized protein n=1 Tax=Clonostachys rosea f. rosea IK726 TaxID=1349383 RepID=A0ACA9UPJ8_BIOOC|nr:unnamed protein product [Clonostachys rosea f. rosea IK726]